MYRKVYPKATDKGSVFGIISPFERHSRAYRPAYTQFVLHVAIQIQCSSG